MEDDQISILNSKNPQKIRSVLKKFNENNSALFDFSSFNSTDQWIVIWKTIFMHLRDSELVNVYPLCLNTIRILTRDDYSIQKHNIVEEFNHLLKLADLGMEDTTTGDSNVPNSIETITEALKCLCNIVFQSATCRQLCIRNTCCDRILRRVDTTSSMSYEIGLYDLKLLFLITALEPEARTKVQIDINGQVYLIHLLDQNLQEECCTDSQMDLICEDLKILFNLTSDDSYTQSEIEQRHLTSIIRKLFLKFCDMINEKELNAVTHAINLLTNISTPYLSELIVKCELNAKENLHTLLFEGCNVQVLEILLRYTKGILKQTDNDKLQSSNREKLPPVLTVLVKCVKCNSVMRHYIRKEILPPLKDVSLPPEQGNELRNYFCRFLTSPDLILRDLAAELLFVCCKENIGRMIKYTGYGNAAGLFATRGLLDCRSIENADYSSDSEDSDTEEYKNVQENINPVRGCYEAPKPDPFAGMSQEQKEYEVMQLVDLMDKLHRNRVVQPCRIGEDGKPQPVEHILELQEELPQQQLEQRPKS